MKQSAVSRLLGNDLLSEIRHSTGASARSGGGVDVEVLLRAAERLCDVYAVTGIPEKIHALRKRNREATSSIVSFEEKVSKQESSLQRRNKGSETDEGAEDYEPATVGDDLTYTIQDLRAEEEEIKELEARKKALEDLVSGMERDLGGLR
jgi:hypothetical protein